MARRRQRQPIAMFAVFLQSMHFPRLLPRQLLYYLHGGGCYPVQTQSPRCSEPTQDTVYLLSLGGAQRSECDRGYEARYKLCFEHGASLFSS